MKDAHDQDLSGASTAGLVAYQAALDQFRCFIGDPAALAEEAIAANPDLTMAHVLKAWLHLLGTEPGGIAVARAACEAAARLPANPRERLHLEAARLLAHGHWHACARVLEDLSLQYPRDLLALQAGHQVDFFTGNARMLRDRIARALPAWQPALPGYHALLSMHAFGLEETGDYAQAEREGRRSVELQPRDGWGWHAVAHAHEMRNDPLAGIAWLGQHAATWSDGSFFAVHNWWHLALFHLELGNVDEVLRLYDASIATGSTVILDLIDATAMLWRLQLRGVDVGARWDTVADLWQSAGQPGLYAFNDLHMMMAYCGAGREGAQAAVLEAQAQGDHVRCAQLLRRIRSSAHRFGGSHAQRDVLDLTLLEAARRGSLRHLAEGLQAERLALRPRTRPAAPLALVA